MLYVKHVQCPNRAHICIKKKSSLARDFCGLLAYPSKCQFILEHESIVTAFTTFIFQIASGTSVNENPDNAPVPVL